VPKKSNTSNKPGAAFVPTRTKVFQRRGGILRLVVLILGRVSVGQRALMQYSRNQNVTTLPTVKHDVNGMHQTTLVVVRRRLRRAPIFERSASMLSQSISGTSQAILSKVAVKLAVYPASDTINGQSVRSRLSFMPESQQCHPSKVPKRSNMSNKPRSLSWVFL
jgi:hypothetical protein